MFIILHITVIVYVLSQFKYQQLKYGSSGIATSSWTGVVLRLCWGLVSQNEGSSAVSTLSIWSISCDGASEIAVTNENSIPDSNHCTMVASLETGHATSIDMKHKMISDFLVHSPSSRFHCMTPRYACRHTLMVQDFYREQHRDAHAHMRCNNHNYLRGDYCEPYCTVYDDDYRDEQLRLQPFLTGRLYLWTVLPDNAHAPPRQW